MKMDMEKVIEGTSNAYSLGNYSTAGWRRCARLLFDRGLKEDQIIAFMLSKHMRWCSDFSNKPYRTPKTANDLRRYLDAERNIRGSLVQEANALLNGA